MVSQPQGAVHPFVLAARAHPTAFTAFTQNGRYRPASVHWRVGDALARIARGETDRLMISMPPRHGKSELASANFPAWYLGNFPGRNIIACSHTDELAVSFGRRARNIIDSAEFGEVFPNVRLSPDSQAAARWGISGTFGGYLATGVGGPITGFGAHVLLIDDPIKSRAEANSATIRDSLYDWYRDTAYTRLEKDGAVILIMTRWHEDDLAGRLLKEAAEGGDQWEVLSLPAINEQGEALWPEKYNLQSLERTRRTMGPYGWAAEYQQRPTPPEGGAIKREWVRTFTRAPGADPDYVSRGGRWMVITTVDAAFKTGISNDYSVIGTWGTDGNNFYLLDVWRQRVEYPELRKAIEQQALSQRSQAIYIEDAAAGQSVIQELKRSSRIPVIAVPAKGSKEDRVDAVGPLFEGGKVMIPVGAPWATAYVEELVAFPNGMHDDQVDMTSLALLRLFNQQGARRQSMSIGIKGDDYDIDTSQMSERRARRLEERMRVSRQMPRVRG